ncbi:MAG: Acyl-[acyl-carrier-protein]--UDP-N-acetylglucosamine O-acyltransferase [Legionellaceae bacterium]
MIDNRADISPSARIADGVTISPWAIIGPDVEIDEGTWIGPHVVIKGPTKIGRGNKIFQFSSIGEDPQDKKYNNERTYLEIGDNNVIREFCTINRGTIQDGGITRIGNNNLLMAYVHVAHDCIIHNHTVFANNASLAGHVIVHDHVILSGFAGIHQFCVLGEHSFVAKATIVSKDVLPYTLVSGHDAKACGLNSVGLRRRGFSSETIHLLKRAYKIIYRNGLTVAQALEQLAPLAELSQEIKHLYDALASSIRGIVR